MSSFIPNENTWIAFAPVRPVALTLVPKMAEITAAVDLTAFIINLNASVTGNTVPVPNLKSRYERTIAGTTTGQFTAEMYRDKVPASDLAWTTLPMTTTGVFYISRIKGVIPVALDVIEVWPVEVTSRTASALASNTAGTFTLTCAVPDPPNLAAAITAT